MLKRLYLMHYYQGQSEALTGQGIRLVKLLENGLMADEIPPRVIILCSPSPQAKKIAEIIAAKFSMSRWLVPVEPEDCLDDGGEESCWEQDILALQDIEAAMEQNSVVLVVTGPQKVEGLSRAVGYDIRLKNSECLVYEQQQVLTEKAGPLTLAGRLTVNVPMPYVNATQPISEFPTGFTHFVQNCMTSRGIRTGALIAAAGLGVLGIAAEVDGRFGLSGATKMKVVAGLEQPIVHIALPGSHPAAQCKNSLSGRKGKEHSALINTEGNQFLAFNKGC
ncbi:MAG: hypothetical protein PHY54_05765 [Methylococcales bacterium]|nr:hypothetical protein [Methylococcales bacterium]